MTLLLELPVLFVPYLVMYGDWRIALCHSVYNRVFVFYSPRSGSADARSRRRGSSMDATKVSLPSGSLRRRSTSRSRERAKSEDRSQVGPVRQLLRSTALCEGHSIGAILIDPVLSDLWVADVSGAITSAHLSVRSKSLFPTRRLMLFGTVGGPSFLSWTPSTQGRTELANTGTAAAIPVKPNGSGVLRAFSPACGTLVEVVVTNSIEAVFRLSAPTDVKTQPSHLGLNHVGRVAAAEVCVLHTPAVEVFAYLPHWNLVAVTSSRTRFIQLWDLYSGLLQLTIQTAESSYCKCMAAYDAPSAVPTVLNGSNMSTAWLAVGYGSGKFVLYSLSRRNVQEEFAAAPVEAAAVVETAKHVADMKPVVSCALCCVCGSALLVISTIYMCGFRTPYSVA
jgi:WD40 repeat protein